MEFFRSVETRQRTRTLYRHCLAGNDNKLELDRKSGMTCLMRHGGASRGCNILPPAIECEYTVRQGLLHRHPAEMDAGRTGCR